METPEMYYDEDTNEKAIDEIIESISMEELALANILQAESEKLMSDIDSKNVTAEELMLIKESIERTVNAISRLKMTLKCKMDLVKDVSND